MKGGPRMGMAVICNGCFTDDIFYRSEGVYGRIDYCYSCTEERLPNCEIYVMAEFADHVALKFKAARKKDLEFHMAQPYPRKLQFA